MPFFLSSNFSERSPTPPLPTIGIGDTEMPGDSSHVHDPEPEEGIPALANWTRAVNGQAQKHGPTHNAIKYLVAEQAGFRNAWALGIAPPPSINVPPHIVQRTPGFFEEQDISSMTPQPFVTPAMQRLASHALYTGNVTTPGSTTEAIKTVHVKFVLQQIGTKRRFVLVEEEVDETFEPFETPVRNTNGEPMEGGDSVSTVSKCGIYKEIPPDTINVQLLGGLEITAEELLTFFPLHTGWHYGINRLIQNGWKFDAISKFINWARNLQPSVGRGRLPAAIEMQIIRSDDRIHNGRKFGRVAPRPEGRIDDLTMTHWELPRRRGYRLQDYLLQDIIKGVAHFPTGEGRRELTMAMEYARENPDELSTTVLGKRLMVSDIPVLIYKHGFSSRVTPISVGTEPHDHPDFRAAERYRDKIDKHDRLAKQYLEVIAPDNTPSRTPSKRKERKTYEEL